jgi:beta-lactamase regulating signal transducer with metallopeptidase domain
MLIKTLLTNMDTAGWIFSLLTQSLAFFGAGWFLMKLIRRASAPLRSGILLTLMTLLLLLPFGLMVFNTEQDSLYRFPISSYRDDRSITPDIKSRDLETKERDQVKTKSQSLPEAMPASSTGNAGSADLTNINPALIIFNAFGLIWLSGFLFFLARLFYGIAFLSGFKSSLVRVRERRFEEVFNSVQKAFPKTTLPALYLSSAINSPMTIGIFRPRIVLPQSLYQSLSRAEFETILIHETAHVYHHDHLSGILQRLVAALYWWNPLAYTLSVEFSVLREYVSDNYAIHGSGAYRYARCLVALAQKTNLIARLPAAVGMSTPHLSLEERVKNIVSRERILKTKLSKPAIFAFAVSAVFLAFLLGRYGWTLTAEENKPKVFSLPAGITPLSMAVEEGRIYIAEEAGRAEKLNRSIAIYSLKDFSPLKKFGRRGEGTGEFLYGPWEFDVLNGSIWAKDGRKINVFSRDGIFQKEIPFPPQIMFMEYPLLPVGQNYVTFPIDRADLDRGILRFFGRVYDPEFRLIKQFYDETPFLGPPPPPPPPGKKDGIKIEKVVRPEEDYLVLPDCIDFGVAENKIFVGDTRRGFHFSVYDDQGNPLYAIDKDYEKLKVPKAFIERAKKRIEARAKFFKDEAGFKPREYYPAFMGFKIADGKIYVATYAEKNDFQELIVMNLNGDILKRAFVFPFHPSSETLYNSFFRLRKRFDIRDDKIYYLAENKTIGVNQVRILEIK